MLSEAISGPASRQAMRSSCVRFGPPPVLSWITSGQTARIFWWISRKMSTLAEFSPAASRACTCTIAAPSL